MVKNEEMIDYPKNIFFRGLTIIFVKVFTDVKNFDKSFITLSSYAFS